MKDAHNHEIHIGDEVVGRNAGRLLVAGIVTGIQGDILVLKTADENANLLYITATESTLWNPGHLSTGTEPVQPLP